MEVQQGLGVGESQRERVLVEVIEMRCPRQLVRRAGKATLPACRGPIDCPSAGLAEGRYYTPPSGTDVAAGAEGEHVGVLVEVGGDVPGRYLVHNYETDISARYLSVIVPFVKLFALKIVFSR